MGYAPRALLAGGLGLAASFLVACGGGGHGLLSSDQASSLQGQLDQLTSALDAGQCGAAANAADALKSTANNLPSSINPALATNLEQGASTVASLAQSQCSQTATTTSTSSSPTTTTSSTTTSTTTSTSTPTTTSTSTSTPTSTATSTSSSGSTPTTSASGGAGLGGGAGNSSGGAGAGGNGNGNGQ